MTELNDKDCSTNFGRGQVLKALEVAEMCLSKIAFLFVISTLLTLVDNSPACLIAAEQLLGVVQNKNPRLLLMSNNEEPCVFDRAFFDIKSDSLYTDKEAMVSSVQTCTQQVDHRSSNKNAVL